MNPSFGVHFIDWGLSIAGALVLLIVSSLLNLIYKRLDALEAAMPERMKQYQEDQERHRNRFEDQLLELRHKQSELAVQVSAIRAKLDHAK